MNAKVVAPQKRVPACSGSGITCGTFEMLSSLKFKLCVEESIVYLQVSMCHLQESVVNLCMHSCDNDVLLDLAISGERMCEELILDVLKYVLTAQTEKSSILCRRRLDST